MDKNISRLSITIIITMILVIVSIPLWNYSSGKRGSLIADSYDNLSVSVVTGEFKQLLVIEDNRALDIIEPTKLSLRNRNSFTKKCELLMLIDKDSTIDYNHIRIAVENKISHLKDLNMYEDNDNYYFVIGEYTLKKYTNMDIYVRIWIGEEIGELGNTNQLITNFITK